MASMLHPCCAVVARYWLAAYMAAMKLRMRARWVVFWSAVSRTVKADEVKGWMKSATLARMIGRCGSYASRASLVKGYVRIVAYTAVPFGSEPATRST